MLRRPPSSAWFVGTTLTLLNQENSLFSGVWSNALYWKIPLTYCVPFLVATYGRWPPPAADGQVRRSPL